MSNPPTIDAAITGGFGVAIGVAITGLDGDPTLSLEAGILGNRITFRVVELGDPSIGLPGIGGENTYIRT